MAKISRKHKNYLDELSAKFAEKSAENRKNSAKNFDLETLENYLLEMPNAEKSFPFDEFAAVFKTSAGKMFAIVSENSAPIRLSLKCDPNLAEDLRAKYESVLPGYHLNKKHWNTILLTGQLSDDEIRDLIRHSFELVK